VCVSLGAGYNSALFDNIHVYGVASNICALQKVAPILPVILVQTLILNIGGGLGGNSTRIGALPVVGNLPLHS